MTPDPDFDCSLCPRLLDFRSHHRREHPDWHNAPVPTWRASDIDSIELLVVGLAPGLRGANRTGRPFTGDYAGDLLYPTLLDFGFASGTYAARPDDGLCLIRCAITNAVRCVPPANKPTGSEINTCRDFLSATIRSLPRLRVLLTLGVVSHTSTVRALGGKVSDYGFKHSGIYELSDYTIISSYHCSRYNTNTGRLTESMFREVFGCINESLEQMNH